MTLDDAPAPPAPEPAPAPARKKGRIVWRVLIGLVVVIALVIAAVALWFFVLRGEAGQRSTEDALKDLRASGATEAAAADGLPAIGVYTALASGSEDIGLPGLTESFGPNAPVTVTHADGGCFVYRVDLNTNHFRTWTFCPTADATFALTASDGSTRRDVPGLTTPSVTRYTCEQPIPYLWPNPVVGDQRTGTCTGTSDAMPGVTGDTCVVEVLDIGVMTVGGEDVPVVHVRSTDTFSGNQGGTEVDEWWLDSRTGLPVRVEIDANVTSSVVDYKESGTIELTSLVPAT